jgi:PKD repeat protein
MRGLLAVALLVALTLAGCAAKPDSSSSTTTATKTTSSSGIHTSTSTTATGSTTASSTTTASPTTSSTTTSPGPSNAPPTATLTAVNATGGVPLNVTFQATGSDPDGDHLNYTLQFGDGSADHAGILPANVTHSYTLVGNFTARLTVTDGTHSVNTTVVVKATAAAAAGAAGPHVVTGSWVTGGPISCEQFMDGDNLHQMVTQTKGVEYVPFDVRADSIGKAFAIAIKPTAPTGAFEIDFYDAGGSTLEYFDNPFPPANTIDGTVPDGAVQAVFFACTPGPGDFTYTAG